MQCWERDELPMHGAVDFAEVEDAMPPDVVPPTAQKEESRTNRSFPATRAIRKKQAAPLSSVVWMLRMQRHVWPLVDVALAQWQVEAEAIPDESLREQALASLQHKRFHCEGGAVYALLHARAMTTLVPLIVALQTISDYLDNLSDRHTCRRFEQLVRLHWALEDAVQPYAPVRDYYEDEATSSDDGGYLHRLVKTCQLHIRSLPSFSVVADVLHHLVQQYAMLQATKHVQEHERESRLIAWAQGMALRWPGLAWQEYAAATGSTLAWFALLAMASKPRLEETARDQLVQAYFPYVCALHILLDYAVDQEEDTLGGDLNFCNYYSSVEQLAERLYGIVLQSQVLVRKLAMSRFHRWVIDGLIATYLSDPKVRRQPAVKKLAGRLLWRGGTMRFLLGLYGVWRRWRTGRNVVMIQDAPMDGASSLHKNQGDQKYGDTI